MTASDLPEATRMFAPDRPPALADLIRASDLERALARFVGVGCDGVLVFDREDVRYCGGGERSSPMARWDQLPPEAAVATRRGHPSFGFLDHIFEVRPCYAGTYRVGTLVVAGPALAEEAVAASANAIAGMLELVLHAGFATWVTSELHLATAEHQHQAIRRHNAELERAIAHLREVDQLKSNFLATVSHELRTPLTSVIGFSEMLLDGIAGDLSAEQADYVRTILARGEELLTLITSVLEMSQLEVGAVRLELGPLNLREVVARSLETVRLAAERAGITLLADVGDVPAVLADAEKLHRILVNLAGNAVKFSRPGGRVRVEAALAPIRRPFAEETLFGDEACDAIRVSVHDEGIGIGGEQLVKIFEPFYQVDSSPTREHGGAGLGLSIVRSLVQAHGGEVWADSRVGRGTTVHFTLPLANP